MRFVFYDIEAAGPDPEHDQMLSFAAIAADAELNETDRFSMSCRLAAHALPDASALLLTGFSIAGLTDPSLPPPCAMVRELRERLTAWSPAVFTGYSSLEFDEVLLAASLRRCLLLPDLTTSQGNARLDVQRLALGIHTFAPDAMNFPRRFDGAPGFRLVDVAAANGIAPGKAHDAAGDTGTTLALARLMRRNVRWLWDHLIRMGDAAEAVMFAQAAPVRLYTEFHHNRPHHWLVTSLGLDRNGDVLGFDLAQDPGAGRHLSGRALEQWLRWHPRPLRLLKVRECPFILPAERAAGLPGLDVAQASRRAQLLADDPDYCRRLLDAHNGMTDDPQPESGDLRRLALQLAFEENPSSLDDETRDLLERETAARMLAGEGVPWMTLDKAFDRAEQALDGASDEGAAEIGRLMDYLRRELAWADASDDRPRTGRNRSGR